MTNLTLYRFRTKTLFQHNVEYSNGEILCCYLNCDYQELLSQYDQFCTAMRQLDAAPAAEIPPSLQQLDASVRFIDEFVLHMPPFVRFPEQDASTPGYSRLSGYPYPLTKPDSYLPQVHSGDAASVSIQALDYYLTLYEGILRVNRVYSPYISQYHFRNGTPHSRIDTVHTFHSFLTDRHETGDDLQAIDCVVPITYTSVPTVLQECTTGYDVDGAVSELALWEQLKFRHIGDFLGSEFVEMLRGRLLIRKCANCGRFFIVHQRYNTDYCQNIAPGETSKTCREVGAQKAFLTKVSSDPVLQAYQRAYKTHYARIAKKKMSKAMFLEWTERATQLREQAGKGELDFEEYLRLLKE